MVAAEATVVIPTRNRRELLMRALRSVLAQRDVEFAVVVVDEASRDSTAEAVDGLGDPRVRVIRHAVPLGVSGARNTGLEAALTPWVAFLDDDDLWSPDKLRAQLDALSTVPGAGWACCGAVHVDADMHVIGAGQPPRQADVLPLLLRRNVVPGGGSGVLVRVDLARDVGGFDPALSILADWDFYLRLSERSPVAAVPRPTVGYYVHAGSMSRAITRSMDELALFNAKHQARRRAVGVPFDDEAWLVYLADLAYKGGQRWTGFALHLRVLLRFRRLRSARSLLAVIWPQTVRRRRNRHDARKMPPGWLAEATTWLSRYGTPTNPGG